MFSWMLRRCDKTQGSIKDNDGKSKLFLPEILFHCWMGLTPLWAQLLESRSCWAPVLNEVRKRFFFFIPRLISQPRRPPPPPSPSRCNQIAGALQVLDSRGQCLHFRLHQLHGWPESSSRRRGNRRVTHWRFSVSRLHTHDILLSKLTEFCPERHQTRSRWLLFCRLMWKKRRNYIYLSDLEQKPAGAFWADLCRVDQMVLQTEKEE